MLGIKKNKIMVIFVYENLILQVFISGGIFLGYIFNYAFSKMTFKLVWRMMFGIGPIPSVLLTVEC